MARGKLRMYIGAAPGVGKSHALLSEGVRRADRGADVMIGAIDTRDRPQLVALARRLERTSAERDHATLDVAAVLARRPAVVLVDDLARANPPGVRRARRWEDVDDILEAGIDVVTTLDITELESVVDLAEPLVGAPVVYTVPDSWVLTAEQIELIDMTPEALRRRLAHGNLIAADRLDPRLAQVYEPERLAARRELALRWMADHVGSPKGHPAGVRERVVVGLTGAPGADRVVRRAARLASRVHAPLIGVHVRRPAATPASLLVEHRQLLERLGGRYAEVAGEDVAAALVEAAGAEGATQLVIGAGRVPWWRQVLRGSVVRRVLRGAGTIDVHVIATTEPAERRPIVLPKRRLSRRRQILGLVLAIGGPVACTPALTHVRDRVGLQTVLLLYLALVVLASAVGGFVAAIVAALLAFGLANWFFTEPFHTLAIADAEHLVDLFVFLALALVPAWHAAVVARRSAEAARARADAGVLARLATVSAGHDPLRAVVDDLRVAGGAESVTLLEPHAGGWTTAASAGEPVRAPDAAERWVPVPGTDAVLAMVGGDATDLDPHVLAAFAAQAGVALVTKRLAEEAGTAAHLARGNELRNALLAAVSHDLRTPLAAIKASVSGLLDDDVDWSPDLARDLLVGIERETDRLTTLVGNLLDMSRIQTGAIEVRLAAVGIDEVVAAALTSLRESARPGVVVVEVEETLPRIQTDPALLERVLANVIANAVAWSPPAAPVRIEAAAVDDAMHVLVVDQGAGIKPSDREAVFEPFQRRGDRSTEAGVGLGLAVARGFAGAVGATLSLDDTPGGGTTVHLVLPLATEAVVVP